MVVDDTLAPCGSANLDGRSLFLNFELMVAFYDRQENDWLAGWVLGRSAGRHSAPGQNDVILDRLFRGSFFYHLAEAMGFVLRPNACNVQGNSNVFDADQPYRLPRPVVGLH